MQSCKILAIGNSFSEDATYYLPAIAKAGDVDLTLGTLFIGGCSLEMHWENAAADTPAYEYHHTGMPPCNSSIREALQREQWDFVTFQQASHDSGLLASYFPYLTQLCDYVRSYAPQAEHVLHMTWAYENGSDHPQFVTYRNDQSIMYDALKSAYFSAAKQAGISRILPNGIAWQRVRTGAIGDTLCRDGYHGNAKGQYIGAAVWYECLTGNSILENRFQPEEIPLPELKLIQQCVHETTAE